VRENPGTEQEFSSSLEHLESGANKVYFLVSFPQMSQNRLLLCLVPQDRGAIPELLPRFDRDGWSRD